MNAPTVTTTVLDRFLRYVTVDTQSDEHATGSPSTAKQLVLLDQLVEELKSMGIRDAVRSEHGVVFATIPATSRKPDVPVIGLVAHVDTSPETSGTGVLPIVHRAWDGRDIVLPGDRTAVLRASESPSLTERIGDDIVTASGTTLLGADDKAGVAEIMTAAEHLMAHPEIPHGAVRIAFTPDEEIGRGVAHFDVKAFGARCAYTMDGEKLGQIDLETFSGDAMTVTFQGFNTHPGLAKGRMVNSIKVAGDFLARLPRERMSPETTEGREGFVHPYVVDASVDRTSVKFIVRDFDAAALAEKERFLESLAQQVVADWPGASASCQVAESYRNFGEVLRRHPEVVEHLREAIRRTGLTPIENAIRGGTDGSRLSYMGLPTPNVFTGGHNFHSKLEWVSAQDMEKAVEVIVQLCRVWEERA
ncbi:MAG: peptidase T [Candidatus Eisenbacteria bacterium]